MLLLKRCRCTWHDATLLLDDKYMPRRACRLARLPPPPSNRVRLLLHLYGCNLVSTFQQVTRCCSRSSFPLLLMLLCSYCYRRLCPDDLFRQPGEDKALDLYSVTMSAAEVSCTQCRYLRLIACKVSCTVV